MLGVGLFFMGQFALFTYLRPFLETVTRVGAFSLSLILLAIGTAGFVGATATGWFLKKGVYRMLAIIPVLMAVIAATLGCRKKGIDMSEDHHAQITLAASLRAWCLRLAGM